MNKIFLVFLSITLINTMTALSNRNINNEVSEPETVEEIPEKETAAEEVPDDTINTTESSIKDDQTVETNEETEEVEEENEEEDLDIIPDVDLTDEEKALVFKYISKIDINYLMNLSSDGITEEESILIIEHLKERLTQEEYEEVEDLIIRFLYSLE